jgi:hypothetical protein
MKRWSHPVGRSEGFEIVGLRLIELFPGLVLLLGYSVSIVWAHGGGVPQLTEAETGPYRVSVWTQPNPLRVGKAHFTVAILEPSPSEAGEQQTGSPVLGATVELQLTPPEGSGQKPLVALASHETAVNKLFYEVDVELPATGRWEVTILVEGPAGSGNTGFEIEVEPASEANWVLFGGLGLVLVAVVWIIQKLR